MQLNPTEMKSGETVLLAFVFLFFNLLWKPQLWQLTQPWKGPMCSSSRLAEGESAIPLGKPKFPWGQLMGSLAASCSSTLLGTECQFWGLHSGFAGSRGWYDSILCPELQELVCVQFYKWSTAWAAQDHIAHGAVRGWHSCCRAPVPFSPDARKLSFNLSVVESTF